jgi:hypothetical protein
MFRPVLLDISVVPIEPDRFPQPPGELGLHGEYITPIYKCRCRRLKSSSSARLTEPLEDLSELLRKAVRS